MANTNGQGSGGAEAESTATAADPKAYHVRHLNLRGQRIPYKVRGPGAARVSYVSIKEDIASIGAAANIVTAGVDMFPAIIRVQTSPEPFTLISNQITINRADCEPGSVVPQPTGVLLAYLSDEAFKGSMEVDWTAASVHRGVHYGFHDMPVMYAVRQAMADGAHVPVELTEMLKTKFIPTALAESLKRSIVNVDLPSGTLIRYRPFTKPEGLMSDPDRLGRSLTDEAVFSVQAEQNPAGMTSLYDALCGPPITIKDKAAQAVLALVDPKTLVFEVDHSNARLSRLGALTLYGLSAEIGLETVHVLAAAGIIRVKVPDAQALETEVIPMTDTSKISATWAFVFGSLAYSGVAILTERDFMDSVQQVLTNGTSVKLTFWDNPRVWLHSSGLTKVQDWRATTTVHGSKDALQAIEAAAEGATLGAASKIQPFIQHPPSALFGMKL